MTNYASGIKADDLSLAGTPTHSADARNVAKPAPPELRLVEASTRPEAEQTVEAGRVPSLRIVTADATPEQGASGVTNDPPAELALVHEPEICIELKAIPETTTWGEDPEKRKARPLPKAARIATEPFDEDRPAPRSAEAGSNRKKLTLIAAVLGCLVVVAGLVLALRSEKAPALQAATAQAAVPAAGLAATPAPAPEPSSVPSATFSPAANSTPDHTPAFGDFAGKLQTLKSAGNWHVFVIYAGEWARKQPGNPDAWRELSLGYLKLRQFRDALDAAKKAVELAPGSFLAWQSLGKVNLGLQESSAALAAFERAAALNDQDVVSLVQAGILEARLGRLSEARVAFAKALALSPEDVDALCGAAAVAQKEGRPNDAEAMALKLKSLDGICRDSGTIESVQATAKATAASRAASAPGR